MVAGFGNMSTMLLQKLNSIYFEDINYDKRLTEEWINKWDKDYKLRKDYKDIEFTEKIAKTLLGIYWNFIIKKPNIKEWVKKSKSVYAKACLVDTSNQSLETLDPNLQFAKLIKNKMCSRFTIKKVIFLTIQTLSKSSNHQLSGISKITMEYFVMAEMEGFAMVVDVLSRKTEICTRIHISNCYQHNFLAALNAFRSMGDNAPYCMILYQEYNTYQLGLLQDERIKPYIEMANEIAVTEGKPYFNDHLFVYRFRNEVIQLCKDIVSLIKATSARHILTSQEEIRQRMNNIKIG